MKQLLSAVLALLLASTSFGQSYPSPTYNNLTVQGTATLTSHPLAVSSGGTGVSSASGTALDNITGFSSTGFLTRTGAGAYAFQSLTNGITLANLAQVGANTVLGNATGSTANLTALSMTSCSTSSSAVSYTLGTGFGCNTSINAATLGGATFAAPGSIGSTTASSGAFTTISATGLITPSSTNGIKGTTAADNANAGSVGEVLSASAGPVAMVTSGTAQNITSLPLSAGDWNVWGTGGIGNTASTSLTLWNNGLSTTSLTQPSFPSGAMLTRYDVSTTPVSQNIFAPIGMIRVNVPSTTTVYCVSTIFWSGSAPNGYCAIFARRER
ncbi:hypothetical protein [Burkholderia ubonensis]|uniref:hypothetical protein n=1 Tax=Burkholderia ubonensis TaxID=101571 RepID=UPI000A4E4B5E|nr:hypothetical protein [Burkholderia ubonensis]